MWNRNWEPDVRPCADAIIDYVFDDAQRECGRASYDWADSITFDDMDILEGYLQQAFNDWLRAIDKEPHFLRSRVVKEES